MTELPPELQSELVEFVRYAGKSNAEDCTFCRRARKLAAKLLPPVDPDIEEASELAPLIEGYTNAGVVAAKMGASKAPWYQQSRQDTAHAANCFAVAAALRELERSGK